uniref:CSON014057 protein n=1 Tax=Culicoides sonorensis TaxID=179676 RepID=A0A336MLU8_CULSO
MGGLGAKCTKYKRWWRTQIADGFYRCGYFVALHPWKTIICSVIVTIVCGIGLLRFHNEKDLLQLYVPKHHSFYTDTQWLVNKYGVFEREENVLIEAPNVLTSDVIRKLLDIHQQLMNIEAYDSSGKIVRFKNLCYKVPVITSLDLDISMDDECQSVNDNQKNFCKMLSKIPSDCLQETILEIFKFNSDEIPSTTDEILEMLNDTSVSPYSGMQKNFEDYLGGVVKDKDGKIISATSILSSYKIFGNYSEMDPNKVFADSGLGSWASEQMMAWEKEFLLTMQNIQKNFSTDGFEVFYQAYRSYGDLTTAVTFDELDKYIAGVFLMFVYLQFVISKYSWVEFRFWLASLGLLGVGMSYIAGCGICSLLGIPYGPIQSALPFLLMGLGVDDMFVIMAVWRKQEGAVKEKPLEERMGIMLMTAGASITITSITDIMAFIVGGLAAMPILQSFCLYSAISIFIMYLFVITFFVAIFTLDEKRVIQNRNGFIPCIKHDDKSSQLCMDKNLMQQFLTVLYSKFILTHVGKAIIIIATIAFTAINFMGLLQLKFRFDPTHHVPENTHLSEYMQEVQKHYPSLGSDAAIIIGRINYTQEMPKILELADRINNTNFLHQVDAWPLDFKKFIDVHHAKLDIENLTDVQWRTFLYQFLNCHVGGKHNRYFKFDYESQCGDPMSDVIVSQIAFKFKNFKNPEEFLPAKKHLTDLLESVNLTSGDGYSTIWGKRLLMWVPDEVVKAEITRNIVLALIGVMLCTAVIIANFSVCFWIFIVVILTLINVAGTMHHVGLMLDMVTYIALQLSIGLCVDYAAHIGHTFLSLEQGTRNERALNTVLSIGTAVIYGGVSTFVALSMLSFAKTYSYRAFFQVNGLIIFFGLYNGVILLPVILSICAPNDKTHEMPDDEMIDMSNITHSKDKITIYRNGSVKRTENGFIRNGNGYSNGSTPNEESTKLRNEL